MVSKYKKCDKCGQNIPEKSKVLCDYCEKEIDEGFTLRQHCTCWGNDSIDGEQEFDLCSVECLINFLKSKETKVFRYGPNFSKIEKDDYGWDYDIIGIDIFELAKLIGV